MDPTEQRIYVYCILCGDIRGGIKVLGQGGIRGVD